MRLGTPRQVLRTMLLMGAVVTLTTLGLPVGPAAAHTDLEASSPADGGDVVGVPAMITLTFGDPIQQSFSDVTLSIGQAAPMTLPLVADDRTLSAAVPSEITTSEPVGVAKAWRVLYRTVAEDGHVIDGSISFTVTGSTTPASAPPDALPEPAVESPNPPSAAPVAWPVLIGLAIATVLGAGIVGIRLWRRSTRP